jgi:hypothetical protein
MEMSRPSATVSLAGPARRRDSATQIREVGVGDAEAERPDRSGVRLVRHRPSGKDARRRGRGGEEATASLYFVPPAAACSISFATTSGWEMNATWLAFTSLVFAFIRFA